MFLTLEIDNNKNAKMDWTVMAAIFLNENKGWGRKGGWQSMTITEKNYFQLKLKHLKYRN